MPDPLFKQLLETYHQIGADEQFILRVLAVFYEPTSETLINSVLEALASDDQTAVYNKITMRANSS